MRVARCAARAALGGVTLMLLAAVPARAQTPDSVRVRGRVVLIAGADLHIELLSPIRLQPGDTLIVQRERTERGRLHVIAADSVRAVVGFPASRFALTRGEILAAVLIRTGARDASVAAPISSPAPVSPAATTPELHPTRRPAAPRGPRITGYLTSETRWVGQRSGGATENRAVPTATLSLRATGLPNRTTLHLFGHVEHYGAGHAPAGYAATELRLYTARLETAAGPLRLGLGRLTSRHDAASGAWDGVSLTAGRDISFAAEAGYEPVRPGAAPATQFPRVGMSVQAVSSTARVRYRGSVGVLHYPGEVPLNRGASAIFTRQSLSSGVLDLTGDARVERSDGGATVLRWGGAWASLRARGGARVHLGFRRYTPLPVLPDTVELAARSRIEAGTHLPFGPAALTLSASTSPAAAERARSLSARLGVRNLPGDIGVHVEGGVWDIGALRTRTAGAAIDRMTGRIYTRAAYRLEGSPDRNTSSVHELEADVSIALGHGSSIGIFAARSAGEDASSTRAQLRLTWGF